MHVEHVLTTCPYCGTGCRFYLQVVDEIPKSISEKALDRVLKERFAPDAENVFNAEDFQ